MAIWSTVFWTLSIIGGLYSMFIALLLHPSVQKNALYAHRFHTAWWHDLNRPEAFGFGEGQVMPFRIATPDGESLYAWHVLPMVLYAQERHTLRTAPRGESDAHEMQRSRALELLRDPEARLVINFHGNAGHLAQATRPAAYKSMSIASTAPIHVLTFDYRGFGLSSGSPSEAGLVADGIAAVTWALEVARVPSHRILLVGQSLGTAVATAVAEHFATASGTSISFAGLLLSSGFSDLPNLLKTYAIGGVVPILSPLAPYPRLQDMISAYAIDAWNTTARLGRLAAYSEGGGGDGGFNIKRETVGGLRLRIVHARDDFDIGWKHADLLFEAAVAGMRRGHELPKECEEGRQDDDGIKSSEVWSRRAVMCGDGVKAAERISRTILHFGGHNHLLTHHYVAVVVREMFEDAEREKVKTGWRTESSSG